MEFSEHYPQYFTATILEWKPLLKPDKYKAIITESLSFLVKDNRVKVYGFIIMVNHIHLIWQVKAGHKPQDVQHSFMKFTAQMIKMDLQKNHPKVLEHFYVGAKDRLFQIWERNSLGIEIKSDKVFNQKLDYIHQNPVKAGLCVFPEDYMYSSASLYIGNSSQWEWLTKWGD